MAKLIEITGKPLTGEWGNDDNDGSGIPVLRTTNFTNEGVINYDSVVTRCIKKKDLSEKFLKSGDIIIEKSGGSDKQPVGRVVYYDGLPDTYLFNNFTGVLRVRDTTKWLPRYVFYALFSNYHQGGTKRYENRTTGLHNLQTEKYVEEFEVQETSIDEQKSCVERLDHLTNLISLRKQQIAKLDELVKARFVEMFGDPVNNPKGWELVQLSSLAEIKIGPFGSLLHKEDYVTGEHPLINPSHIVDGQIVVDNDLTVDDTKYEEMEAYQLRPGDVVLGRRGEMGRCAVVCDPGMLCGTGSLIIRPSNKMHPYFLQKIISYPTFKKAIEDMAVGVTMMNLNVPIVSSFMVPELPLDQQENYLAFVNQIDKQKLTIQQSLDKLELMKKALMQKYFE